MNWSGLQRSFLLYKPDKLNEEIPLLLVLHGSMGSGEQIQKRVNEFVFMQIGLVFS